MLGGPAVTYRTFDDRTTRLANALLSVAFPGERIAAWLPTGIEYLEVYAAAAKAGLVLVPVHERFTTGEATYLLDDSQARVLIHGAPMDERVAQLDTAGLARIVTPAAYEEFLSAGAATMPAGPAADDLFLVAYTSGTTGFPKGAMVTHRAVLRGLREERVLLPLAGRSPGPRPTRGMCGSGPGSRSLSWRPPGRTTRDAHGRARLRGGLPHPITANR